MTDAQLQALIVAQLGVFIPRYPQLASITGITVAQNFQPVQAGRQSAPAIYFVKVGGKRYGFTGTRDTYVPPTDPPPPPPAALGTFRHEEIQFYEQRYQFMALVPQSPARPMALTASDVLDTVAGIIGSDACRGALRAQGVGILRITDVRNPQFTNDQNRFEADPSFDVVFTHTRTLESVVPKVETYDARIVRV